MNLKKITTLTVLAVALLSEPVMAGTATYYSNWFNGRTMANGKRYNPRAMTAASNRYPLGTWVTVTNRRNGRSVRVKITDRCRCYIDLSRAAFGRIAKHSQGRVPVRVRR